MYFGLFSKDLAKTIGMSLEPTSLIDVILSYLTDRYRHYHTLPDDRVEATSFVLGILAEQAIKFQKKHGYVPCLFIDGIDLLAKHNRPAFISLVENAKVFANRGDLRIVFVSSEGEIVPLMKTTSSSSRSMTVVEVLDVSDDDAKDYLISKGMPKNLASRVVELTGGRLIHLIQAFVIFRNSALSEDDQMKKIEAFLYEKNISGPLIHLELNSTIGKKIVKYILSNGDTDPHVLMKVLKGTCNDEAVLKTIKSLVQANLFRYTATGRITWHSRLVRNAVLTEMKSQMN